ncbi:cytochrome P450 [Desarmillaria tabescens]|uniref:Cytochrome P450 n=1 Tax=Armillaria tabescens TaxID=1929756 RepID=A0AA39KH05_ARMTA|nr:cytochrome P450 [Desarmillaria tabescens]KAK0458668.1 cytochrome P450 [Desarmillaria tabescens]
MSLSNYLVLLGKYYTFLHSNLVKIPNQLEPTVNIQFCCFIDRRRHGDHDSLVLVQLVVPSVRRWYNASFQSRIKIALDEMITYPDWKLKLFERGQAARRRRANVIVAVILFQSAVLGIRICNASGYCLNRGTVRSGWAWLGYLRDSFALQQGPIIPVSLETRGLIGQMKDDSLLSKMAMDTTRVNMYVGASREKANFFVLSFVSLQTAEEKSDDFNLINYVLPCSALWALRHFLTESGFSIPVWPVFVLPFVSQVIVRLVHGWYIGFAIRRDAAAQGAILMPYVQESSISIMWRIVDSFKNGYPSEVFQKWSEQYGNTFSFGTLSSKWTHEVFTSEPEHIKAVLATQFRDFEKGAFVFNATKALFGVGVFSTDGEMWKFHRTMTRPFFNKERISDFDNFERHAVSTITQIKARLREGYPVDFQDVVARFTLDSATEFLLGKDVNSISAGLPYPAGSPLGDNLHFVNHPSNAFVKAFAEAQVQNMIRVKSGASWPLREIFRDKSVGSEKKLDNMTLLDRLVEEADDPKVVQDELVNVLVAGRDSTASLLTMAVYMMCEHPDMVTRLRSEIFGKVGNRRPTYEDIRDMKVSAVSTTLPNKGRPPYYVPRDTLLTYSVFLMHRRTDLWGPDALEFDPDRFLDSRLQKYLTPNPYIFLPFNASPRICRGQQNFSSFSLARDAQPAEGIPPASWTPTPGTTKGRDKIMFGITITIYAKGGLWVRMEEAKDGTTL